jgi:hypothetical protein
MRKKRNFDRLVSANEDQLMFCLKNYTEKENVEIYQFANHYLASMPIGNQEKNQLVLKKPKSQEDVSFFAYRFKLLNTLSTENAFGGSKTVEKSLVCRSRLLGLT